MIQNIVQTSFFIMALFLTFALIVKIAGFCVTASAGRDANISWGQSFLPAIFWGLFFFFLNIP